MNKLITDYIPLANSIAYKRKRTLPKCVTIEELKSAAYMGLIDASKKFNPSKGSFYNYASIRINGSIKDHLKSLIDCDINPNIDKEVYFHHYENNNDFFEMISNKLEENEFKIIKMYYLEFKTMKQIGLEENISESRVSQIISFCHDKLKRKLVGANYEC